MSPVSVPPSADTQVASPSDGCDQCPGSLVCKHLLGPFQFLWVYSQRQDSGARGNSTFYSGDHPHCSHSSCTILHPHQQCPSCQLLHALASPCHFLAFPWRSSRGREGPSLRLELSPRCCVHTHLWGESLCTGVLTRRLMAGHWAAARPHPSHSAGCPAGTDPGSLWGFLHESHRWVAQPCRVLPDGCFLDLPPLWSWRAPASHHPASGWHWPDPETYHSDYCTGNPRV